MAVTKAELALVLYEELGFNKREAKDFIEEFFEAIKSSLSTEHAVKLSGFGHFGLREKNARPGRNPKTGEEISISARRVVTFKSSLKLKERVAANTEKLLNQGAL
jgi:integration host factor subunit alpha